MEAEEKSKSSVADKIGKELTRRQALKAGAGLTGLAVALAALPAKAQDAGATSICR